ncbi:hypothetical protein AURDEDRAFT_113566 [Auricularia subglabra TFB-10046 SS5]|nr:hypothetical protein AURDEDRAFT_113566 [Auricularia subglabra TFB-10046 SS5]
MYRRRDESTQTTPRNDAPAAPPRPSARCSGGEEPIVVVLVVVRVYIVCVDYAAYFAPRTIAS